LRKTDSYLGKANKVMLVWGQFQLLPAEQYRKAHYSELKTDIAICEDPNFQREQLGEHSVIYHWR
jgi:hypothetical protein